MTNTASRSFKPDYRWDEMHLVSMRGLNYTHGDDGSSLLPHAPYADLAQVVVHTWRGGGWFSWMFGVGEQSSGAPGDRFMFFDRGGHQGGEGTNEGDVWFVEGAVEELDDVNEFFHDAAAGVLYLIPNATDAVGPGGAPPSELVVPQLAVLFDLHGSEEFPVANVSFDGVTFVDGRPTFMDPHGVPRRVLALGLGLLGTTTAIFAHALAGPQATLTAVLPLPTPLPPPLVSGGDWALERLAALLVEGATGLEVSDCTFTRIDSNALMLSGFTRDAWVHDSEFALLGGSAVALWGRAADGFDVTGGQVPRRTVVERCFFHDLGLVQKQSSGIFQAIAPRNTYRNNLFFNLPRAAVNFNDGAGGGSELAFSLLVNTCRESGDHGAFNQWDRLPYLSFEYDGVTASVKQAQNLLHHNVVVSNYAAYAGCYDHDDGASYANMFNTFCAGGGHKNNFDGHSKRSTKNLYAFPGIYGERCFGFFSTLVPTIAGQPEVFENNVCVQDSMQYAQSGYQAFWIMGETGFAPNNCPSATDFPSFPGMAAFNRSILLRNNTYYVPAGGNLSLGCGDLPAPFRDYRSMGWEVDPTIVLALPSSAQIIEWARALLD